jgi:hypothetical protein
MQREVTRYLDTITAAENGTRNKLLNTAALRIGHFVPHEIPEDHAWKWLSERARLAGLAEAEITATIRSGLTKGMAEPYQVTDQSIPAMSSENAETTKDSEELVSRRVDLRPYLDGTYVPPSPVAGGARVDGQHILYPGLWHSCIAATASGKSWFALWHAVAEIRAGNTAVYAHFEEYSPAGTIDRLRTMAPDLTAEAITERFIWLDCSRRWKGASEFAAELPDTFGVLILDGINAACSINGLEVVDTKAVGAYRYLFVTEATKRGAAVLSLGHPPKAKDRQTERHGFGSTAWLDEVDGVGLRLEKAKQTPIMRGRKGYSAVYSVKDRYGQVEQHGEQVTDKDRDGWFYQGALWVDSTGVHTEVVMTAPEKDEATERPMNPLDKLGEAIMRHLVLKPGMRFETQNALGDELRAADVKVNRTDLGPALARLALTGRLTWPPVAPRRSRPGWVNPDAPGLDLFVLSSSS